MKRLRTKRLSMAFGHAVIVIPAITGAAAPFHPAMYAGLILLHASVALRLCADARASETGRMASGALTVAALIAFGVVLGWRLKASRPDSATVGATVVGREGLEPPTRPL